MSRFAAHKQIVLDACLTLSRAGYLAGTGGNLALRLDQELFAVTPSGADYFALRPDDICVLRLRDLQQVEGDLKPSVESAMHAAMLRFKPAMQASVHTHQPLASAIALLNINLPVPAASQAMLGRQVTVVPYAPSGTGFLVRNLRKRLNHNDHAYLLKNHGVICAAGDMAQAIASVAAIESAAAAYLRQHIAARGDATTLAPSLVSMMLEKIKLSESFT